MTCFNREKIISEAIESVLASTYTNFELIIVDDCSTDDSVEIAKSYEKRDSRIRVFVNNRNLGDYPNRNKAASHARGKYLKYVDSDDFIYQEGLEILVRSMEQFPEAGFGICSLKPNIDKPFPFVLAPREAYEYHFFGPGLFHFGPLSSIFLKSAFEAMNGFKKERMISDIDMWHRMSLVYPVVLMQDGIVWQRIHEHQELSEKKDFIIKADKIKWNYLLDPLCTLSKSQLSRIRKMRLKRYSIFILQGLKNMDLNQIRIYMKCFLNTIKIKV